MPVPLHPEPETDSTQVDAPTTWFNGQTAGATTVLGAAVGLENESHGPTRATDTRAAGEAHSRPQRSGAASQSKARDTQTFSRIYRAFLAARVALAIMLLGLMAGAWAMGPHPALWMISLSLAYLALTLTAWIWPSQRQPSVVEHGNLNVRQALLTLGVDLLSFALLHDLTGASLNTQALMVLPVLMGAVLLPRVMALGVAAAATLNLLAAAWVDSAQGSGVTSLLTQAGLSGFGLFVIAALASELAARLVREERAARGSMELARQQAQLNRLVIEEMSEGVIVIDRQGRVRTANPAARRLLAAQGHTPEPPFLLKGVPAWQPLVSAVEKATTQTESSEGGQEVRLRFDDQSQRDLRLRVRFNRGHAGHRSLQDLCVVFLEDLRSVRARQRQDKLAAMGRMSAGIAHEVRNPLAAISQANALMAEDAATPTQVRLTQMVADNVTRIQHTVDDILAVAPGVRPPAPAIDPIATLVSLCNEWRSMAGLSSGEGSLLDVNTQGCKDAPGYPVMKVRFEPDHLQRVLVNLLDNALRYNSGEPGAILVGLRWVPAGTGLLVLSVFNDGAPMNPDTERALFEPFFSTRSQGTGLGLYICRELCERHGASIDFRLHPPTVRHRNEFFVTMPTEPSGLSPHAA